MAEEAIADEHFFFEGVEKVMEIDFVPGVGVSARGLRDLTRAQLDDLCTAARCTIISTMSNEHLDSYVLSESSLFVYSHKMILKTCGTTTLLMALEPLLKATAELGMKVEWVAYTRKDFQRPGQQKFPHRDHIEESTYLKQFFPEGNTFILGPITSDHWVVFVADYLDRPTDACVDRTLDMMMFGIDEEVAKLFVRDAERFPKDTDVTRASGIDTLLPGSQIQEFCFDPCGYSMNGLLYDSYWTIHITPEATFSYASFETNIRMSSYAGLIKAVLSIFRPRKWTMTLFADSNGLKSIKEAPFQQVLPVPLVHSTSRAIMGPCVVTHDPFGNAFINYTGSAAAAGAPGSARPSPLASGSSVGSPAPSPTAAASPSTAAAAFAVSAAGGAAALPMTAAGAEAVARSTSAPGVIDASAAAVPSTDALTAALLQGACSPAAGAGLDETAASTTTTSPAAADAKPGLQVVVPAIKPSGSKGNLAALGRSGAATPSVGRTTALSYMMTTKSQTEFVGEYSALFGIYALVHSAANVTARGALPAMPDAASDSLSLPRAKYVVARRVEELARKTRAGSL